MKTFNRFFMALALLIGVTFVSVGGMLLLDSTAQLPMLARLPQQTQTAEAK